MRPTPDTSTLNLQVVRLNKTYISTCLIYAYLYLSYIFLSLYQTFCLIISNYLSIHPFKIYVMYLSFGLPSSYIILSIFLCIFLSNCLSVGESVELTPPDHAPGPINTIDEADEPFTEVRSLPTCTYLSIYPSVRYLSIFLSIFILEGTGHSFETL